MNYKRSKYFTTSNKKKIKYFFLNNSRFFPNHVRHEAMEKNDSNLAIFFNK